MHSSAAKDGGPAAVPAAAGAPVAWPADDAELALLVACAAWPPSERRAGCVRLRGEGDIDWVRFDRIVQRHRLAGLAVNGLAAAGMTMPDGVCRQLQRVAQNDLVRALETAREAVQLVAALADDGIAATVLKGPPLAALAYGTLALRQMRDLDLLVAPNVIARASALMRARGYDFRYAGSAHDLRPDRSALLKDIEFVHPRTGLVVEVHTRLAENEALLPAAFAMAIAPVTIAPGLSVPALTGTPLLLYLMVHGFRHSWFRLKWLADVAALVAPLPGAEQAGWVAAAEAQGLRVIAQSTLLLLGDVMGLALPAPLVAAARRSRRARLCAAVARRRLRDERPPEQQSALVTFTTLTLLLASSRPAYLRREVTAAMVDNPFAVRFGGGRTATILAILLRPMLWGGRRLQVLTRRRADVPTSIDGSVPFPTRKHELDR